MLSHKKQELVCEAITGNEGFEVAINYLLKVGAFKKRTPKVEKELWKYFSSLRLDLLSEFCEKGC